MRDFFVPKDLLLFSSSMGMESDLSVRGFSGGLSEAATMLLTAATATPAIPSGIAFIGAVTHISTSTTNQTVALPQDIIAGDLVLVLVAGTTSGASGNRDLGVITTGYTELCDLFSDDLQDAELSVSYKIMGDVPDTQVVTTGVFSGTASYAASVIIQAFRGVDQTTPLAATTTTAAINNTYIPNPPAITPTVDNALVVSAVASVIATRVDPDPVLQAPSPLQDVSVTYAKPSTAMTAQSAGMGSMLATTAGVAIDLATWTILGSGATSSAWAAATIALRPAT